MSWFGDLWSKIKNTASNWYNSAKDAVSNVWNKVSPYVRAIPLVGDKIATGVETVAGAIDKGATGVAKIATGDVMGGVGDLRGAYNTGKEGVNKLTNLKNGGVVMNPEHSGPYRVPQKHHNTFQK